MKHLGIDYGTKRIGLSVSDTGATMAFPHSILENSSVGTSVRFVAEFCEKEGIKMIVIGNSLDKSFQSNPINLEAKKFGENLNSLTGIPVQYEWEGYSSALARNMMSTQGVPRGDVARKIKKEKTAVDSIAATVILQSFLDKKRSGV